MSESLKAAVLGCRGRGAAHARQMQLIDGIEVVAVVDQVMERAESVVREVSPSAKAYDDFGRMLCDCRPDVVAICTSCSWRLQPVRMCIAAGVKAIQCEKPMAASWLEAVQMHEMARQAGVLLAFCHQRRFAPQFTLGRQLLAEGVIGNVRHIEGYCPNLFDWGTHWLDLMRFWTHDRETHWVMAQIDRADVTTRYGQPVEPASTTSIGLAGGVELMLRTGHGIDHPNILLRAVGDDGLLEAGARGEPKLRYLSSSVAGWQAPHLLPSSHGLDDTGRALAHLLDCLHRGEEPTHGSGSALRTTELIFAAYASSLDRTRVRLPLGERAISIKDAFAATS